MRPQIAKLWSHSPIIGCLIGINFYQFNESFRRKVALRGGKIYNVIYNIISIFNAMNYLCYFLLLAWTKEFNVNWKKF